MKPKTSNSRRWALPTAVLFLGGVVGWHLFRSRAGAGCERPVSLDIADTAEPTSILPSARSAPESPQPDSGVPKASSSADLEVELERDPGALLGTIRAEHPRHEAEAQRLKVLEVRALVRLDRIAEARDQAGDYYARWPEGPDVRFLQGLTGLHPTPR